MNTEPTTSAGQLTGERPDEARRGWFDHRGQWKSRSSQLGVHLSLRDEFREGF